MCVNNVYTVYGVVLRDSVLLIDLCNYVCIGGPTIHKCRFTHCINNLFVAVK